MLFSEETYNIQNTGANTLNYWNHWLVKLTDFPTLAFPNLLPTKSKLWLLIYWEHKPSSRGAKMNVCAIIEVLYIFVHRYGGSSLKPELNILTGLEHPANLPGILLSPPQC